jgi:hypothetical protein
LRRLRLQAWRRADDQGRPAKAPPKSGSRCAPTAHAAFSWNPEIKKVYRLDALEAYNKKLVKKISVKEISETGSTATEDTSGAEKVVDISLAQSVYEGLITSGYVEKGIRTDKYYDDKKNGAIAVAEEVSIWMRRGDVKRPRDGYFA